MKMRKSESRLSFLIEHGEGPYGISKRAGALLAPTRTCAPAKRPMFLAFPSGLPSVRSTGVESLL